VRRADFVFNGGLVVIIRDADNPRVIKAGDSGK
jgi:hypothetical protein